MTSSSTILTGEDEEEHRRTSTLGDPTYSHRRRWTTPVDSGGGESLQSFTVRSLEINSDPECREHLGGKMSPWGPWGPPLLTESRSNAPSPRGEDRRGRNVTRKQDLPPYLTTLDCNGRPRFHHRRVRSEGRLEIASVAVELPEIVSVRGREGLRIGTVRINQQQEEEDGGDDEQQNC